MNGTAPERKVQALRQCIRLSNWKRDGSGPSNAVHPGKTLARHRVGYEGARGRCRATQHMVLLIDYAPVEYENLGFIAYDFIDDNIEILSLISNTRQADDRPSKFEAHRVATEVTCTL